MKNHHIWLHRELRLWLKEGLVSSQQAGVLRARYPVSAQSGWSRLILSGLGAIIFGLGAILLIAYNWADMHRYTKLAMVFCALASAHGAGLLLGRAGRAPVAAEGLNALGTMLFGAAIWLVAQIYHIESHYPDAFIAWALGALLLAWALPSVTQGLMAVALVLVWQAAELFDFSTTLHGVPGLILAGVYPLYWRLRSGVLAGAATSALLVSLALALFDSNEKLAVVSVLLVSGTAVAVGRLLTLSRDGHLARTGRSFSFPGQAFYVGIVLLLSFPGIGSDSFGLRLDRPVVAVYFFLPLVLAALAWGALLAAPLRGRPSPVQPEDWVTLLGIALASLFTLFHLNGAGWWTAAPFNLLLLAYGSLLVVQGSRQVHLAKVVIGCLLLSTLAMVRYLDLFDSLLLRSLVFFAVGGMLFAAGNGYNRRKRHLGEGAP